MQITSSGQPDNLMTVNPEISRKEFHAEVGPIVYTQHSKDSLAGDMASLPFSQFDIYDLYKIATRPSIGHSLKINETEAARSAGIKGIEMLSVYASGFDDRHFTILFASTFGVIVSDLLEEEGVVTHPLSLLDQAKMLQTGWFGDLANQMALSAKGVWQPFLHKYEKYRDTSPQAKLSKFLLKYIQTTERENATFRLPVEIEDVTDKPLSLTIDPDTGLHIVEASHEMKAILRRGLNKKESVGCPVARTSTITSTVNLEFLEDWGYIGEASGFASAEQQPVESGKVKLKQGAYTAIDDIVWLWGDYIERYGLYMLDRGCSSPKLIEPTDANKFVLLD